LRFDRNILIFTLNALILFLGMVQHWIIYKYLIQSIPNVTFVYMFSRFVLLILLYRINVNYFLYQSFILLFLNSVIITAWALNVGLVSYYGLGMSFIGVLLIRYFIDCIMYFIIHIIFKILKPQ